MHAERLARLTAIVDAASEWTGRLVAWLTLAMLLVTTLVVALRYLLSIGFIWMQESVTWMHALVFMLGAAYTLKRDEHVRVDVFYRQMTMRRKAILDFVGTLLLLLPVTGFLFFASLDYVAQSWTVREASREAGGLPGVFLLKTTIPLTALALAVQGLAEAARCLIVLAGGQTVARQGPERHGP